eukprot:jgi/Botrbrau1/19457/Bobra.0338s0077.1
MKGGAGGDGSSAHEQSAGKQWVWQRVAELRSTVRDHWLHNAASTCQSSLVERPTITDRTWGFASNTPSIMSLLQVARDGQSRGLTTEDATGYMATLQASRTFQSPDCVEAMAEVYGLVDGLDGLQATVAGPCRTAAGREAVHTVRAGLKQDIRRAWAEEAVRRGIDFAKSGNLEGAERCYKQALELEPQLVDGWVAQGALHANSGRYTEAVSHFETALRLDPGHQNARKYLDLTRAKMPPEGTPPSRSSHMGPPTSSSRKAFVSASTPRTGPRTEPRTSPRRGSANRVLATHTHAGGSSQLRDARPSSHAEAPLRGPLPAEEGERDSDSSTSQDDPNGRDTGSAHGAHMDVETALQIFSKHYDKRAARKKAKEEKKSKKRKKKRKKDDSQSPGDKKSRKNRKRKRSSRSPDTNSVD